MQFKALTALSFAAIALAAPTDPIPTGQCNTGPVQCCNTVQSASSNPISSLLGLLGIVVGDVNALIGLTCNPISVIGIGGNSCSTQPVCCTENNFSGLQFRFSHLIVSEQIDRRPHQPRLHPDQPQPLISTQVVIAPPDRLQLAEHQRASEVVKLDPRVIPVVSVMD
ncbi:hypothetical protein NMY22_g13263 [Coprinellus aureogranulatus]|nr:hypothetical protein NMY22_g13263 [Coprinellus aureogranulatus]